MRVALALITLIVTFALVPAEAAQRPAYIVVDAGSGTVLSDRDSEKIWYPASVTKLMTAYLTFKALKAGRVKLTSPVVESQNALNEPPSKMGFKVGTVMNVDNALKMMLVHSSNDIAVAIAETVGGNERGFIAMMNAEAHSLGMASTHYDNPNGLPSPGQLTTARDLAVLARALWTDFPEYREYFRIPAIKTGRRILRSQNTLLERYHGTNGMKTGFICDSGFNMVVSATRNGRTLIVVVLGSSTPVERAELAAKLLNQAFSGLSLKFAQVQLASFHAGASPGPVVNMHDQICARRKKGPSDEDPVLASLAGGSALEPHFTLMAPVAVYTGGTDPNAKAVTTVGAKPVAVPAAAAPAAAAPVTAAPAGKAAAVPVPRLRPRPGAGAAADPVPVTPAAPPKTPTKLAAPKAAGGPTVPKVNASAGPGSTPVNIDPGRFPSDQ